MDYNGGPRRKTAGEPAPGQENGGVRDWQKDTWYGPAPAYGNPFDEPEDAPELRESRSENVNDHLGDFWKDRPEGYQYTQPGVGRNGQRENQGQGGKRHAPKKRQGTGRTAVRTAVLILCAGLGIWIALRYTIFSLREIRVEGNRSLSREEILEIAGIHDGDSLLGLDEHQVEERINGDYRLQFRYLEKTIPSQVTLKIREREACCWLTYGGILYTMDKNRMVMSETEKLDGDHPELNGLVELKGLKIRSGCRTGQTLTLNDRAQETLISGLFLEMKVLGCTGMIREADLSNQQSLLMTTRDGYIVSMGDGSNLHAKLRSLMIVRDKLREMNMSGGTINVIRPETPLYSPASI